MGTQWEHDGNTLGTRRKKNSHPTSSPKRKKLDPGSACEAFSLKSKPSLSSHIPSFNGICKVMKFY
jgi:hypothetical protein